MKKFVTIYKIIIVLLLIVILGTCIPYRLGMSPVSKESIPVEVEITADDTYMGLAAMLKEKDLIKSDLIYKVYVKISKPSNLQVGKYTLDKNMGVEGIINALEQGNTYNPDSITITFNEGINMRAVANIIANNTNNTEDDVYNKLKDTDYLDKLIKKYWFIDNEVKNNKIYYSLEGYLFPDTYEYENKDVTVEEIFEKMLDRTGEVLLPYKELISNSNYSLHELLTLASIVELEGAKSNDRASVAGVFYNRLDDGWTLGSDVTTYYAEKMDDWTNGLKESQLDACNAYNTRGTCFIGLPVGPISNPSLDSFNAVMHPDMTDNYYFVADCSGKTYLNKTESGHFQTINKLKNQGNWCDN